MATVIDLPTLETLRDEQRCASRELAGALRGRLRLQLVLELAADAAVVLTATAAILVFLDWWFRFGLPVRAFLLVLCARGRLGVPRRSRAHGGGEASRLDELSLAVTLDRYRPGIGQQIADVLQLPDLLDEPGASIGLAGDGAAGRAARHARPWPAQTGARSGTASARRCTWRPCSPACSCPLAFAVVAPRAARLSVARWLLGSSERWPQQTYLTVMGLDAVGAGLLAPRDERFLIEVRADLPLIESRGKEWIVRRPRRAAVLWRKPEQPASRSRCGSRNGPPTARSGTASMVEAEPGAIPLRVSAVGRARRRFDLTGGDDWLGPLTVERVDRPSLAETQAPRQGARGDLRRACAPSKIRASTCSSCPTPRSS